MPRKRKLPPGVVSLDEFRERRRLARVRANARAFMALPEAERRRQLMEMLGLTVTVDGETVGEKRPGDEAPGL
jgi:hypothetical protein